MQGSRKMAWERELRATPTKSREKKRLKWRKGVKTGALGNTIRRVGHPVLVLSSSTGPEPILSWLMHKGTAHSSPLSCSA